MEQLVADRERDKNMIEEARKDVGAINQNEIMERTSVGNDDAAHYFLEIRRRCSKSDANSSLSLVRKAWAFLRKPSVSKRFSSRSSPICACVIWPFRKA